MEHRRDIARYLGQKYSERGEFSSQTLDILINMIEPMKVLRGTVLLHEGEICKYIYYIERGLVRQSYYKKGKQLTEHIGYEGSMIMCIDSLFNHEPSLLTIETLEPCMIYGLKYDEMVFAAHSSFEFCNLLMSIYKESLIISQHKADMLRFSSARERYEQTMSEHPEIIRRTPLHIVASYLQITPETLSRVRTLISDSVLPQ